MQSKLVLGAMAVLACVPALGVEPARSVAEFSVQDPDQGNRAGALRVSVQPGESLVLDFGLDAREHRGGDVGMASLGAGWRLQHTGVVRVVVGLSADAVGGEFGPDDESGSMSGASAGAGFNVEMSYRANDRLELLGRLKGTTIEACRGVASIGARFYVSKRLALTADWLDDDFGTRVGIGLRLDFSRL